MHPVPHGPGIVDTCADAPHVFFAVAMETWAVQREIHGNTTLSSDMLQCESFHRGSLCEFKWSTQTSRNVTIRLTIDGPSTKCTWLQARSKELNFITSIRSIHWPTSRETLGSHSQRLKPASKRSARGQEAQHSLTCFFADSFLPCVLFLLYVLGLWEIFTCVEVEQTSRYGSSNLERSPLVADHFL